MKSKELRIGAENDEEEVRILQIALSERYSLSLQANGHFSKKTEALVRRLQEDMDEEVTGVASPLLWEALMESHRVRSDLPPS
jgi:peptidoglycan hydrolase-like protein with peptidoglycan-binding domain